MMVQGKVRTAQGRLFRARRQKEPAGPRGLQRGCRDVSLAALPGGQLLKFLSFLMPGEDRLQCWRRSSLGTDNTASILSADMESMLRARALLAPPCSCFWGAVRGACPIPGSATGTAEPACVWQELWLLFALGEIKTNGALAIATAPARRA